MQNERDWEAEYETEEIMQDDFPQDKVKFTLQVDEIFGGGNGTLLEPIEGMYCIRGEVIGFDGGKLEVNKYCDPLVDVWVTASFLRRHALPVPEWNCPEGLQYHGVPANFRMVTDVEVETVRIEVMDLWWFVCREMGTNFNMGYEYGN